VPKKAVVQGVYHKSKVSRCRTVTLVIPGGAKGGARMSLQKRVEIPLGLTIDCDLTMSLLKRKFPDCSVSKRKALNIHMKWVLRVKRTWWTKVDVLLVQEKTFTGKEKGPLHFRIVKVSPILGPLLLLFASNSLLDAVAGYLDNGFRADAQAAS
jgi:hypothetical protein